MEFKGIRQQTKLMLAREEGLDVEFKESLSSLKNDDLVAFANADLGGTILVGVREKQSTEGKVLGEIIGCKLNDSSRRVILDRAQSCIPPIDVSISAENLKSNEFIRIDINSGNEKPYCTSGGTYKVRGDGRKISLLPGKLLSMFMEKEGKKFIDRFTKATQSLQKELDLSTEYIVQHLHMTQNSVSEVEFEIEESLNRIGRAADGAEESADEALGLADDTHGYVLKVLELLENADVDQFRVNQKLDALLQKFEIEDPRVTQIKFNTKNGIIALLREHEEMGTKPNRKKIIKRIVDRYPHPDVSLVESMYDEALLFMRE